MSCGYHARMAEAKATKKRVGTKKRVVKKRVVKKAALKKAAPKRKLKKNPVIPAGVATTLKTLGTMAASFLLGVSYGVALQLAIILLTNLLESVGTKIKRAEYGKKVKETFGAIKRSVVKEPWFLQTKRILKPLIAAFGIGAFLIFANAFLGKLISGAKTKKVKEGAAELKRLTKQVYGS